jgi:hypothetical protein
MPDSAKLGFVIATLLASVFSAGQECDALKSTSAPAVTEYLQHVGDDPAASSCVEAAFHQIATAPPELAVPTLITYIGYKRPLNKGERLGIFMHGNGPNVLYPAVHELFVIGSPAEPALIGFIAKNKDNAGPESKNAVYTLLLIHHGDVVSVLQELHKASVSSTSDEARDRLQGAARDALKWCDERAHAQCEDALKGSNGGG